MTTLFSIIADAFERTKADQQGVVPRLRDKWIRGSAWVKALNALGYVNHTQEVKVGDFNRAMARSNKYGDLMVRFDGSNHSGIFKVVYRREQFYYVCTQAEQTPAYPPMSRKAEAKLWFDSVVKAESRAFRESSEDEEEESEDDTETQAAKRQRTQRTVHITPASIANQSYWENEVAERCFGKKDDDDSVQDAIERRISILRSANETVEGWRHVVVGRDPDNLCSSHDIHAIRQKSQLLCLAYSVALEKIETNKVERTTQASRDLIKHDRPTGQWKEVTKTVAVLRAELVQVGVDFLRENPKMTRLKEIAKDKNIPLKHHVEIIDNGWLGKPKGLHQVLLERGLIDINRIKEYSKKGKKTPTGARDLSTSLIHLISGCSDFKNEENALQALGRECGILVDCTPKFHAELAGEGIEYTWAFMKGKYRRAPLEQKRTRDKFKALVRECSSAEKVPKEQVRKFAARSRAYICTYFALSQAPVDDNETQEFRPQLYKEIERLSKNFRGHRCALDFDRGFVEGSLKEEVET